MEFEYLISLKQRLPSTVLKEHLDTLKEMNVEFVIEERIPLDEQVEMIIEDEDVIEFIELVLKPASLLNKIRLIKKYLRVKNYTLTDPNSVGEKELIICKNIVENVYKLKLKEGNE